MNKQSDLASILNPQQRVCILLALCFFCQTLWANGFQVTPTRINLKKDQTIKTLQVRNSADEDLLLSLKIFRWDQLNNEDHYETTQDLLVTPPIVRIPAKSNQIVRVGLLKTVPKNLEKAYRLYLHEIIPQSKQKAGQLSFALRVGIPIFLASEATAEEKIIWKKEQIAKGTKITAYNQGNVHVLLSDLALLPENGGDKINEEAAGYILAGSSRYWILPNTTDASAQTNPPSSVKIIAKTEQGRIETLA